MARRSMGMFSFQLLLLLLSSIASVVNCRSLAGTVVFGTVGRARYGFDVFLTAVPGPGQAPPDQDFILTDGISVNYNGHLVDVQQRATLLPALAFNESNSDGIQMLAYTSERQGRARIHYSLFRHRSVDGPRLELLPVAGVEAGMLPGLAESDDVDALQDRPTVANGRVVFVSTREPRTESRQGWSAVYSTDIFSGKTVRLTPKGVTDYSPAVSPSGDWTMVASSQGRGWGGELEELDTDLYVFKTRDGSSRKLVVKAGGWPSWADDSTVYFHRKADDGWWSVFKVVLDFQQQGTATATRVTPPGLHAFTPAASRTGKWIAVATRRPETTYRHIEIFDLESSSFVKLTQGIVADAHHYNPFVSQDSQQVGYHRCRGKTTKSKVATSPRPRLEYIKSPINELALVRVDGNFPVFSPNGKYIAFIPDLDEAGIYVTRLDGSGKVKIFNQRAFGLFWDRAKPGVLYTSYGVGLMPENTTVRIVAILNADKVISGKEVETKWKVLTAEGTANNAFPSGSPDGKLIVFRSGRSGHKNLYIMDAAEGENKYLRRLTEGPWIDTMASWSPDGEWIAFSSDRHNPGNGSFELYFVRPDGTGLHRVLNSSTGGQVNHPFFSPDSKSIVFTTDYAGVSAEPVSVPNQFLPHGEIFIAEVDGSNLQRLTHNAYEDGTPSWGPLFSDPKEEEGDPLGCDFADSRWLKSVS